ncbi:hypothetical protein IE81DRAFT_99311 [Ceraceosorus guamensis]|uniref:Uncharacterized protein n=1 Tax=Ceraceosorus guamensis TaxID=1522189 RepID=A0A316W021_9BASI|nr:hypothetical protein IE81DRAFT_99311 [Ceraceosorus guamensis]PWN43186.1 hypothetical protein IE81DRAFT_99311 [Ceraceosorus guamensis]
MHHRRTAPCTQANSPPRVMTATRVRISPPSTMLPTSDFESVLDMCLFSDVRCTTMLNVAQILCPNLTSQQHKRAPRCCGGLAQRGRADFSARKPAPGPAVLKV